MCLVGRRAARKDYVEKTLEVQMRELCDEIAAEADRMGYAPLAEKIRVLALSPLERESWATTLFVKNVCCESGCSCSSTNA